LLAAEPPRLVVRRLAGESSDAALAALDGESLARSGLEIR
jgi:hypothetical protein